jgi:molybdopterin/thiamine biosynthesis adenylyltransferase
MERGWERYQRQLGLVYQQRVASLRALLVGDDPCLTYVLTNLALLGAGSLEDGCLLIISDRQGTSVTHEDISHQCLLMRDDVGGDYADAIRLRLGEVNPDVRCEFVPRATPGRAPDVVLLLGADPTWDDPRPPRVYGRTGRVAFAFGSQPAALLRAIQSPQQANILTAPLASALGAFVAQEVLRVCRLLRPYPIERFWLTANIRLSPGVTPPDPPRLNAAGTPMASIPNQSPELLSGEARGLLYRAVIPFGADLTRILWGATIVDAPAPVGLSAPRELVYYSPFTCWRPAQTPAEFASAPDGVNIPPLPRTLSGQRLVIGGAGGLGSWLITTLAASPLQDSHLLVIESDRRVERHNLNRQVLYRAGHLGAPKSVAVQAAVRAHNPELHVETNATHVTWRDRSWLLEAIRGANAVLTTFDNYASRYLMGLAAAKLDVPLVNAGSLVFNGDVELLRPGKEGCIECIWESEDGAGAAAARRGATEGQSCTREDDEVGQIGTAIVTTNAIAGSLQALVLLAHLATVGQHVDAIDHKLQVWGQENVLARCRLPELLGRSTCPIHCQRTNHAEHMERYSDEGDRAQTSRLPARRRPFGFWLDRQPRKEDKDEHSN